LVTKTKVPPATSRNGTQQTVRKLDIACGQHKQPGYKGIDIAGDADIIWDLNETPWPIKASCVTEAFSSHYVEHIPHYRPQWNRDGWWVFFDELYRVMKKDGTARFIHPYVQSDRAFWDPTHVRFIHEQTWYYLDREWREREALDHYDVSCDFEVVSIDVMGVTDEYISRNQEAQGFQRNHYWNVFGDLNVLLKARK
jgi:hypothetical protein